MALVGRDRETAWLRADGSLLVVDDAQWADEPSLFLPQMLLRDPGCGGLVCCATRRVGETGPGWERLGPDLLGGAAAALLTAGAGRELTPRRGGPRDRSGRR